MKRDDVCLKLIELGIATRGELQDATDQLPEDQRESPRALLKELARIDKLTRFQANAIFRGKGDALVFGSYLVEKKLGRGGFGTVYRARHCLMNRTVAIKVINPALVNDQDTRNRFLCEFQTAAKLEHPNIVKAYDASQIDGSYYLAMEFVLGELLSEVVNASGPLPFETAVDYIIQAATGLEYAHRQGVIHRDIKPANMILDPEGRIRILDMGLARFDQPTSFVRRLVRSGMSVGTKDFMAPEQSLDADRADRRSDIYSLGCTLYALLAGEVMFPGISVAKKMVDHQIIPAPKLSDRRPDVAPELEAVYRRMVAKRPKDRFQTMSEVIRALEPFAPSSVFDESELRDSGVMRLSGSGFRLGGNSSTKLPLTKSHSATSPDDIEDIPAICEPSTSRSRRETPFGSWRATAGLVAVSCGLTWIASNFVAGRPGTPLAAAYARTADAADTSTPAASEPSVVLPTADPVVLRSFDFSDAANGRWVSKDEQQYHSSGEVKYDILTFHQSANGNAGTLLTSCEDGVSKGFDGRPGLLRFELTSLPAHWDFIGFKLGDRVPMHYTSLPTWTPGQVTLANLEQTLVEFRIRAVRPVERSYQPIHLGFSIEQNHRSNYESRLEFSRFVANDQWQLVRVRLSTGGNQRQFLEAMRDNPDAGLCLIWASNNDQEIESGDAIEIDDIRFLHEANPSSAVAVSKTATK